jgi:hypothetical protein
MRRQLFLVQFKAKKCELHMGKKVIFEVDPSSLNNARMQSVYSGTSLTLRHVLQTADDAGVYRPHIPLFISTTHINIHQQPLALASRREGFLSAC